MRLLTEHRYAADPATVFGMLSDEDFLRAKLEDRGDTHIEVVECGEGADGFRIITRRTVAIDLPGFAERFLKPTNTVVQTDVWGAAADDGTREGVWRVEAKGVPVTMSGTMRLVITAEGCAEQIEGDVKSPIPLVGGKLASFIGGTVEHNLDLEQDFARRWLDDRSR